MSLALKLLKREKITPVRSFNRSILTTLPIEQELANIKTAIASSNPSEDNICSWLLQLAVLYTRVTELLSSSTTRDLFSQHQNKQWAEDLLDKSVNFLDVCGSLKDMVTRFKEHVIDVQSALRRRTFDLKCENRIKKYNSFRKKMKKEANLLIASLKHHDNNSYMITYDGKVDNDSNYHERAAVMQAVTEVSETTVSIFEPVLQYFSVSVSKPNRWSILVSKLIRKGMVTCEDQQEQGIMNKSESIDELLQNLCRIGSSAKEENMKSVKYKLETQETQLNSMEIKLECIFRNLIRTRAFLLDIVYL